MSLYPEVDFRKLPLLCTQEIYKVHEELMFLWLLYDFGLIYVDPLAISLIPFLTFHNDVYVSLISVKTCGFATLEMDFGLQI